jgi:outer membrane protein assembly factor BamB
VVGNRAVTAGYSKEKDTSYLYFFNAQSGKKLGQIPYPDTCGGLRAGLLGPVATPAIEDGRVYMVAAMGALHCLDLKSGKRLWSKSYNKDKDSGPFGEYGDGVSPVIMGDLVIAHLTTSKDSAAWFAFSKDDGERRWKHNVEKRKAGDRAYSCAVPCSIGGVAHVILVSNASIDCVDLEHGKLKWAYSLDKRRMDYGPFSEPAVFDEDKFFLGMWYAKRTAAVFQMKDDGVEPAWEKSGIGKRAFSYVIRDGFVYGYGTKALECMDLKTGKSQWTWRSDDPKLKMDSGELILVGDKLVWLSSSGMLQVGNASPDKVGAIADFKALGPSTRDLDADKAIYHRIVCTSPTFAGGRVYCRSPWGEVVCVDVK